LSVGCWYCRSTWPDSEPDVAIVAVTTSDGHVIPLCHDCVGFLDAQGHTKPLTDEHRDLLAVQDVMEP
jgi:hypothetical protein